jgi:hypothetical protein
MRPEPIGPTDAPKGYDDPNLTRPAVGQEISPHHRGPTGAGVLRLALAVVLMLVLQAMATTDSDGQATRPTTPPPGAQHWPPTCKEATGGR